MTPEREKWDGDIFDDPRMIEARKRVILALEQGPQVMTRKFASKLRWLRQCGDYPAAIVVKDGRVTQVFRNRCRCRGCPVCGSLLAADTRSVLDLLTAERMRHGARFSMITLTMPHAATDLAQKLLSHLFAATSRFQRAAGFRKHVGGWARGVEVPWSAESGYHPHVHYLVEASMWPMAEIKALWTRCMLSVGGPHVPPHGAHVKGIKDGKKGMIEVVGYPFKVADLSTMPLAELCQLLYATKGRHLTQFCRPWTKRIGVLVEQQKAQAQGLALADGTETFGFVDLLSRARRGDWKACQLLLDVQQHLASNPATVKVGENLAAMLRADTEHFGWLKDSERGSVELPDDA